MQIVLSHRRHRRIERLRHRLAIGNHKMLDDQTGGDQYRHAEHGDQVLAQARPQQQERQHGLDRNADEKDRPRAFNKDHIGPPLVARNVFSKRACGTAKGARRYQSEETPTRADSCRCAKCHQWRISYLFFGKSGPP